LRSRKRKSPTAHRCARLGFLAGLVPDGHGTPPGWPISVVCRPW
jgi:hypothetical protein